MEYDTSAYSHRVAAPFPDGFGIPFRVELVYSSGKALDESSNILGVNEPDRSSLGIEINAQWRCGRRKSWVNGLEAGEPLEGSIHRGDVASATRIGIEGKHSLFPVVAILLGP